MTIRLLLTGVFVAAICFAQQSECVPVEGEQITGRDLAHALRAFSSLPPDVPLAPSPLPGAERIMHPSELQSIAVRFSVHADLASDVCFRLFTEPLSKDAVLATMRQSLEIPEATIEITETSTQPAPRGRLEFPRDRLGSPASQDSHLPVLWRGDLIYAGERRFAVWAMVRITAPVVRFTALENLRQGEPIQKSQIRRETIEGFPPRTKTGQAIDDVVGLAPIHNISAGAEVRPEVLTRPNDVVKGDLVRVEVRVGAAHLALNGRAEASGRVGDLVAVLNPESSRTFQARVEGKGRVVVEADGGSN